LARIPVVSSSKAWTYWLPPGPWGLGRRGRMPLGLEAMEPGAITKDLGGIPARWHGVQRLVGLPINHGNSIAIGLADGEVVTWTLKTGPG